MNINLKEYYYDKFLYYAINNKCYRSFKKHKKEIIEYIDKIVSDHNECLLTESFIIYLTNKDLYMKLGELATNDKYMIYEMLCNYYQELIKSFNYSSIDDKTYITENDLTKYLGLETKRVLTETDLMFLKMCRMHDLNIYYFALMKLTVFYIISYCHINECMNKYDELINYYQGNMYKIKDEILLHGIDIMNSNKELIDIVSSGLINRNKRMIK